MFLSVGQSNSLFEDSEFELFEFLKKKHFEPMSVKNFSKLIDIDAFVEDEGWPPEDIKFQDPDVVFYAGKIGTKEILGISHSGVDQLFTFNGQKIEKDDFQLLKVNKRLESDALSWVLLPVNSVDSIKRTGKEYSIEKEKDFHIIKGQKGTRYQLLKEEEPIAALHVVNNAIDTIYTSLENRQQSLSKKLIDRALLDYPDLKHSDVQTDLGREYSKRSTLSNKKSPRI